MNVLRIFCVGYFVVGLLAGALWTLFRGPGWFLNMKRLARLAIVASMVMSAGVGIWIQVGMDELLEPTFDPTTDYVWPNVPLAVTWNPADMDGYNDVVQESLRFWNSSGACPLFEASPAGMPYQVMIKTFDGAPCGKEGRDLHGTDAPDALGGTWDCRNGTVEIQVKNLGDVTTAYRVIIHELGHVLRLKHDPSGVMAPSRLQHDPTTNITAVIFEPMQSIQPNRKDVAALRARYCQQPSAEPARN